MINKTDSARPRALLLGIGSDGDQGGPWPITRHLVERGYVVTHREVAEGNSPAQVLRALKACRDIAQFDLAAANDYTIGFALALSAFVRRSRARIAIVGMNLSRRPFRLGFAPFDAIADRVFGRLDSIIVHSTPEVAQFVRLHHLDPAKFTVVPWGFDLPAVADTAVLPLPRTPRFVAMVGRNNRDFATLARALDGTGVAGVFVGCSEALPTVDAEIAVHEALPFDQCLGLIRESLANVISLKDSSRGAGHITAVAGMALGKPHIFSDADVITDYLTDGVEGLAVPLGDVAAMRTAILRLAGDATLAASLGEAGRRTATTKLTNRAFAERTAAAVLPVAR